MRGTANTIQQPMARAVMDTHDIITVMLESGGGSEGQSAVQKIAYIIKTLHPHLDIPDYRPQYFGPSSLGVHAALAELVAFGFASEHRIFGGRVAYAYDLTGPGKEYAADVRRQHPDACDMIRSMTEKCMKMCCRSYLALSFAAKMHHMRQNGSTMSDRDAIQFGNDLLWGITENEMRNALNMLRTLGLYPAE